MSERRSKPERRRGCGHCCKQAADDGRPKSLFDTGDYGGRQAHGDLRDFGVEEWKATSRKKASSYVSQVSVGELRGDIFSGYVQHVLERECDTRALEV